MDKRNDQPSIVFDVNKGAYEKAKAKAERDLKKDYTYQDTWAQYKKDYLPNTVIELTDEEASKAFSIYGLPPFYHIKIRHEKARTGYLYDWHVSPSSGVIITRDVQKDPDVASELALSEIIYHLLTKEVPRIATVLKPEKIPTSIQLTRFIQYNVASGETFKVVKYLGMPEDDKTEVALKPDSDFALAVLGTVNFNCVVYLLKDHGAEFGLKGIESITLLKVKNQGTPSKGVIVIFKR